MNPTKLVLHFSDFSVIFYAIYNIQQKHLYYLRIVLQQGPWRFLFSYRSALALRISPREEGGLAMRPLGGRPARLRPNSGRAGGGAGRGRAGEVHKVAREPMGVRIWAQRRPARQLGGGGRR
jgi:hypothetical protein